jgi:putative phosphoesterase
MTRIGLLSDTHHYIDDQILECFDSCDEIWHAGDFGTIAIADRLAAFKPLKGVYGNIDGQDIRGVYREILRWQTEGVRVLMKHIGGYPPRYNPPTLKLIKSDPPQLFISGHSHICKIMFDDRFNCLHMNPGAAGKQGWHSVRTLIRFTIDGKDMKDCEVVELGKRG